MTLSGRGPGRPAQAARNSFATARRRAAILIRSATWRREILLVAILYGGYELARGMGDMSVRAALGNGREILHVERVWHLNPERVLNEAIEHVTWLAVGAAYFYSVMHYVVTPTVLIWMYRKHRAHYGPTRTALVLSTTLGLVGYLLLPTAPPRMLSHSGLQDTLADTQSYGWWGGEGSAPRGLGVLTNQFAAMPSLHVGWAIWCGALIAMYARRRWVRALGVGYPVATTIVVMATGNHYLLDAIAGAVTMGAGALLTAAFSRRTSPPRVSEHEALDEVVAARSASAVRAALAAGSAGNACDLTARDVIAPPSTDADLCRARH